MSIEEKFMELCKDTVAEAGCNLLRVSWKNNELCFYIDKEGGVDLNDCEKITRAIDCTVETNDKILGENYNLSVSSIGTDGKDWEGGENNDIK
jgi:ribosome maturation factor RimP